MGKVPHQSKSNSLFLSVMSVMAGIQVIAGGVVLIDAIPADVSGILLLIVGAVNAGVMYYLNGDIVSLGNVVAYQPNKFNDHSLYAGGASTTPTGDQLSVDSPVGSLAERVVMEEEDYSDGQGYVR